MSMYNIYVEGLLDNPVIRRQQEHREKMRKLKDEHDEAAKKYRDAIDDTLASAREGSKKIDDMLKRYHNENSIYIESKDVEEYKKRKSEEREKMDEEDQLKAIARSYRKETNLNLEGPEYRRDVMKAAEKYLKHDKLNSLGNSKFGNTTLRQRADYVNAMDSIIKKAEKDLKQEQGIFAECVLI